MYVLMLIAHYLLMKQMQRDSENVPNGGSIAKQSSTMRINDTCSQYIVGITVMYSVIQSVVSRELCVYIVEKRK
jgi:hypothetical protein